LERQHRSRGAVDPTVPPDNDQCESEEEPAGQTEDRECAGFREKVGYRACCGDHAQATGAGNRNPAHVDLRDVWVGHLLPPSESYSTIRLSRKRFNHTVSLSFK
jgi:hypothetical protein